MWLGKTLIGILVINTLTMLTIAHADRGKPTLKDDERPFRYGLFRDLKMNAKMNAKSMPVSYSMNAKLTKLNTKFVCCQVDYNIISTLSRRNLSRIVLRTFS